VDKGLQAFAASASSITCTTASRRSRRVIINANQNHEKQDFRARVSDAIGGYAGARGTHAPACVSKRPFSPPCLRLALLPVDLIERLHHDH